MPISKPNNCGTCRSGISTGCAVEHKRLETLIKKETEDRENSDKTLTTELNNIINSLIIDGEEIK